MADSKQWLSSLLAKAGVTVNGPKGHDIIVHDPRMYHLVHRQGTLGLGNSYMDGMWDCNDPDHLDELFYRLSSAKLEEQAGVFWPQLKGIVLAWLGNRQSVRRAFRVGKRHYDLGEDLFEPMLGSSMAYSCSYCGRGASTLEQAQYDKYQLICEKLHLKPGSTILEIGCGWGGFARHVSSRYDATVVGLTISERQAAYARRLCAGLPVEIRLQDYRTFNQDSRQQFDAIVSVGMLEHVGLKNYEAYFRMAQRCLKPEGLFLLHTIGGLYSTPITDPWLDTHIFENGKVPSMKELATAMEGKFQIEDLHNFGQDYDWTLMQWHQNFKNYILAAEASGTLPAQFDIRFQRMWSYYLQSCAGAFRARRLGLWQFVLSPNGVEGGYVPVR